MIKVTTNDYVFKFVGGEPPTANGVIPPEGLKRKCHYCQERKSGGMICVYSNREETDDTAIYVCPACAVQGCKESEEQWKAFANRATLLDLEKDVHDSQEGKPTV